MVGAPVRAAVVRPSLSPLVRNALALMVSSMGSAGIGIIFWGVAAHLVPVASIGRASAELSAMSLLASLASLSLASTFVRFLPVSGDRTRTFVARCYGTSTSLAVILAVVCVIAGFGHRFLPAALGWRALFIVVVAFWVVFALQDAALTGLRATKWVAVENVLFGLGKLALDRGKSLTKLDRCRGLVGVEEGAEKASVQLGVEDGDSDPLRGDGGVAGRSSSEKSCSPCRGVRPPAREGSCW